MASVIPPKKNTAYVAYVSLNSQANSAIFQANPTLAAGDVKVAIDDGAPANLAALPVVDADFTKRVKLTLTAAEMNGDNVTVIFSDAAGAEWCDLTINLQTATKQFDDLATPANVNTEVLDVLATDTFAEPASVPAATSTLKDKLNWLFALARNKITQTSSTSTLRNDADSGDVATSAVSEVGGTFTRGEWT